MPQDVQILAKENPSMLLAFIHDEPTISERLVVSQQQKTAHKRRTEKISKTLDKLDGLLNEWKFNAESFASFGTFPVLTWDWHDWDNEMHAPICILDRYIKFEHKFMPNHPSNAWHRHTNFRVFEPLTASPLNLKTLSQLTIITMAPCARSIIDTKGRYGFFNKDFYILASEHLYPRATPKELQAHFASGTDHDQETEWFKAQLIHYGLPPCQTRLEARARLLDAVNAGRLEVPAHLLKIERRMKRRWRANNKELKDIRTIKSIIDGGRAERSEATTSGTKRKATDDDRPAKRAKTAASNATTPKTTTPKPKPKPRAAPRRKRQIARHGDISQLTGRDTFLDSQAPAPRLRRTTGNEAAGQQTTTQQTAGRSNCCESESSDSKREVQPYSCPSSDSEHSDSNNLASSHDFYDFEVKDFDDQDALEPLGPVKGFYRVKCPYMEELREIEPLKDDKFFLDLTVVMGGRLWGDFGLGNLEGIMRFGKRPVVSSRDRQWFTWRGEHDGSIACGNGFKGWVKFLGGGRILGCIPVGPKIHGNGSHQNTAIFGGDDSRVFLDPLGISDRSITFKAWHDPDQPAMDKYEGDDMRREWSSFANKQIYQFVHNTPLA
ncbi:hypothetical protein NM208_g10638 [Fusarium decemcellulare]|uniref:Uncharacterized protein n=1 Tax=Fusarium decemcellulare TaxID=57161 RepID=A0ACC1RX59_9HYPO|nr:hypothetical protein NM208_g10638 [Fusarium decemcellulare]